MAAKTVTVTIVRDGSVCYVPVPFDPKETFGKVRAPVKVTLNGYSYRSTIASMGGTVCIPLRKSHREAAGLEGGERLTVTIALDEEARKVALPPDLARALQANPAAGTGWQRLSYTHQREYVEAITEARKPETRARRIADAVRSVGARASQSKEQPRGRRNPGKAEG